MATATKATRKQPDFTGTPGKLVQAPAGLVFGSKTRVSPYDGLLGELSIAAKGSALQFADVKAKASIYSRAKKLGMRVLYAESGTTLYVQFAGWLPDSDHWKKMVRDGILDVIETQPRAPIQIATTLRAKGISDVDAGVVDAILKQLEMSGEVQRQRDGSWSANGRTA